MNLLEFQRRMAEDVRRPLTDNFEMQCETPEEGSITQVAAGYVKPNDRLTSFERLEIYNRQYWFRVLGALEEDYSALQAVVGAKKFNALAVAYLQENPSRSFTLRNLGSGLPDWLEAHPEFAGRRRRLALDVARLEWAYVQAFDSASLAPCTEVEIATLNGQSSIVLQPHVQLLSLNYPVDEFVIAVHQSDSSGDMRSNALEGPRKAEQFELPRMHRQNVYLAVHRYADAVYYRRLERECFLLLGALQKGLTLELALESVFKRSFLSPEEQSATIEACFAHATQLGWFTK
ncbi:MAG: DNA-binding domain-containing protein [Acidobacteriaceae bacterium]